MRAVILEGPHAWKVGDAPERSPDAEEVVVAVAQCGICGTDRHTLAGDNALVRYPAVSGHEFVGTVIETGADASWLPVGTRVAVDPSRSCGHCRYCHEGRANLCPEKGGYGSRYPGGFAERSTVLARACHPLPDHVSWDAAVLAEPLACVLHGVDRVSGAQGSDSVVVGAGPIGLLTAVVLRRRGWNVSVAEVAPARAALAAEWGFGVADADTQADLVIDATGAPAAIQAALGRVRRGGTLLLMGVAPRGSSVDLDPYLVNWMELTIVGSMAINGTFGRAVELIGRHPDNFAPFVTHRVRLEDFGRGLDLVTDHAALKVVVAP